MNVLEFKAKRDGSTLWSSTVGLSEFFRLVEEEKLVPKQATGVTYVHGDQIFDGDTILSRYGVEWLVGAYPDKVGWALYNHELPGIPQLTLTVANAKDAKYQQANA